MVADYHAWNSVYHGREKSEICFEKHGNLSSISSIKKLLFDMGLYFLHLNFNTAVLLTVGNIGSKINEKRSF